MCVRITVLNCHTQHSTEQFWWSSYPPDNHHNSDDVYWTGGGLKSEHTAQSVQYERLQKTTMKQNSDDNDVNVNAHGNQ